MPFKDIDYKKLSEANILHKNLYKKIAEINAIREGNISKAELISGKELVKKISPLELYTETEKVIRKQAPLVKAIKDIPNPLSLEQMQQTIRDPLVTAIHSLPQPPTARAIRDAMTDGMQIVPPPIEYRDEEGATAADIEEDTPPTKRGLTYDPDAGLDFKILEKYDLPKPSVLLEDFAAGGDLDLDKRIDYVTKNITNAQARKRTAVKSQDLQKETLEKDIETTLKSYKDELKTIQNLFQVLLFESFEI
jgi:hypothetical protein